MPFAPVLIDRFAKKIKNYKQHDDLAKFMTVTYKCKNEFVQKILQQYMVDKTARPQILFKSDNDWFYKILDYYKELTNEECLMNTSFNSHESQ